MVLAKRKEHDNQFLHKLAAKELGESNNEAAWEQIIRWTKTNFLHCNIGSCSHINHCLHKLAANSEKERLVFCTVLLVFALNQSIPS